ncbi:hypothetical protein B0J12DRAFT_696434 [Macrophomina phaseolina]|uniref:Uncharacterized protein n=1 Tax=Macrophomina phaseolina TaxID=35725 RepID=A0ABQ8GKU7_9PEZI|nr:hypothetical protein B0J12DRAFT_696434 [Macrophomina phaseolina]
MPRPGSLALRPRRPPLARRTALVAATAAAVALRDAVSNWDGLVVHAEQQEGRTSTDDQTRSVPRPSHPTKKARRRALIEARRGSLSAFNPAGGANLSQAAGRVASSIQPETHASRKTDDVRHLFAKSGCCQALVLCACPLSREGLLKATAPLSNRAYDRRDGLNALQSLRTITRAANKKNLSVRGKSVIRGHSPIHRVETADSISGRAEIE